MAMAHNGRIAGTGQKQGGHTEAGVQELHTVQGELALQQLVPRLFPFFRHTIASVRLAVLRTLQTLLTVPQIGKLWIDTVLLQLTWQNMLLEERRLLATWLHLLLTPIGTPLDVGLILSGRPASSTERASGAGRTSQPSHSWHNVDAAMLKQDLALVEFDVVLAARIAASTALGQLLTAWPPEESINAFVHPDAAKNPLEHSELAQACYAELLALLEKPGPAHYTELDALLQQLRGQCLQLHDAFAQAGVPMAEDAIPAIDTGAVCEDEQSSFTATTADEWANVQYQKLLAKVAGPRSQEHLAHIKEKHRLLTSTLERYSAEKEALTISTQASLAGAAIAYGTRLMQRSAHAMARLVALCVERGKQGKGGNPADKIIKNICGFLCADASNTPVLETQQQTEGILSLSDTATDATPASSSGGGKRRGRALLAAPVDETPEAREVRLIRRGAEMALREMAVQFEGRLFDDLPKLWASLAQRDLAPSLSTGQEMIDALQLVISLSPHLDATLHGQWSTLVEPVIRALGCQFAAIRHMAARCLAVLCGTLGYTALEPFMKLVLPLLGDADNVLHRQGAIEAVSLLVKTMDEAILPFVIFLIVPVLGRMSDSNDPTRLTAANCFAQLIKLVPLESGIPDPPGFSPEMMAQRGEERRFLEQLMDTSKLEKFTIPVSVNAELRKYQQDGVNWLAFLNRYQLHGILCDDMGLGKTLQSICCLASDHHLRAERYAATNSPEFKPLCSLVVCPPTLTGHWRHEIRTYVSNLKPLVYSGPPAERARLLPTFANYDVIIMSYDIVRNDIENLAKFNWNYCILDEGHMIKNAKAKLTIAVKRIKANHRVILSGTPIQNNVLELWSLFDFLMPGFLGTERQFNERYGKAILASRDSKTSSKEQEAGALALEALHKQ
ncbi:hypothetical protein SYNPS1DRAFT_23436, partial [Syncephalis pseudoplumigaleata]